MARQQKTERQRAEEALATAERQYRRASDLVTRLRTELNAAEGTLTEANSLLTYRRQHPALQKSTTTTNTEENPTT